MSTVAIFVLGLLTGTCIGVIVMGILSGGAPASACKQNCNQGRSCTCTAAKSTNG